MVVGQENDLCCLINLSRSGDIVVQTCLAQEAKMDSFLSCFWPTGWPTSTEWILKPLVGINLFGPIWLAIRDSDFLEQGKAIWNWISWKKPKTASGITPKKKTETFLQDPWTNSNNLYLKNFVSLISLEGCNILLIWRINLMQLMGKAGVLCHCWNNIIMEFLLVSKKDCPFVKAACARWILIEKIQ